MINIGDIVKLNNSSFEGKVINIEGKNKYVVKIQEKNIITNLENLTKLNIETKNKEQNNLRNIELNYTSSKEFFPEIMIRHQTVEEAMYNLDNFISEAIYYNINSVKIIHGKHGGILRKAVHDFLKMHPKVESFRLGNYFEGSYGVTIAKLK